MSTRIWDIGFSLGQVNQNYRRKGGDSVKGVHLLQIPNNEDLEYHPTES